MNSSFFPVEHLPGVHVVEKHPDKRLGSWERHAGNENRKRGWSVRRWRMEGICTNLPGYARASKDKKGRMGEEWNCIGKEDSTNHQLSCSQILLRMKMKNEKRGDEENETGGFVRFRNKILLRFPR